MRLRNLLGLLLGLLAVLSPPLSAASTEYLDGKPLTQAVRSSARPVSRSAKLQVPLITWGGDVATVHALDGGFFSSAGLDVELQLENNFPKQVEAALAGRTPFLRGTMGMINAAAEVFKREGIDLVVIYQMTWSTGGDAMVVRPGIGKPADLKGKTIALQLYGPHMDYVANILNSGKVPLSSVKFRWLRELTLPTYDTRGKLVDPVSAFVEDANNDAAMCIIPDALALTSGGEVGTGAAGSVKGARILLSTKTASRIISDVYAVRGDWFESNRAKTQQFVHALLEATEDLERLLADKAARRSVYQERMSRAAQILFDSSQAVPDVEALLGDCEFVGHRGNVAFFTGQGTTRNLEVLTREVQTSFKQMGLMGGTVPLRSAGWDYAALGKGLSAVAKVDKPKFDPSAVAKKIEQKISVEPTAWAEEGTLFQIEIGFEPNQSVFPSNRYADDFQVALTTAQTYGGSLIVIEGHSDPMGVLKAKKKGENPAVVRQMEQQAKNLSLLRAQSVRGSFLDYCTQKRLTIDESQFLAVGLGISTPIYNPPRTKEEWDANRRVVFRIKQIEAELSEFTPLD